MKWNQNPEYKLVNNKLKFIKLKNSRFFIQLYENCFLSLKLINSCLVDSLKKKVNYFFNVCIKKFLFLILLKTSDSYE